MEFDSNKSIFLQIGDYITEKILKGTYSAGDRIPSVRELASGMGVNPNTIMRTFNELQQMNIIENKRGIGYFVSEEAKDLLRKKKRDEFFNSSLPEFLHQASLLGISADELKSHIKIK